MILVDTNVILDVVLNDAKWGEKSLNFLTTLLNNHELFINPIIYGELSAGFETLEELDSVLTLFKRLPLPYDVAFLAEKAFVRYKKRGGAKIRPLSDFFIGAHASVLGGSLITRDNKKYRSYFPKLKLLYP